MSLAVPAEVLEQILLRLDASHLVRVCSLVCRQWNEVVTSDLFWKKYLKDTLGFPLGEWCTSASYPLLSLVAILRPRLDANLLRNCCGEDVNDHELASQNARFEEDGFMVPWPEYSHWTIESSAGDGWKVEEEKVQINSTEDTNNKQQAPSPLHLRRFYSASVGSCYMSQIVCLDSAGFSDLLRLKSRVVGVVSAVVRAKHGTPIFEVNVEKNLDVEPEATESLLLMTKRFNHTSLTESWQLLKCPAFELTPGYSRVKLGHGGIDVDVAAVCLALSIQTEESFKTPRDAQK